MILWPLRLSLVLVESSEVCTRIEVEVEGLSSSSFQDEVDRMWVDRIYIEEEARTCIEEVEVLSSSYAAEEDKTLAADLTTSNFTCLYEKGVSEMCFHKTYLLVVVLVDTVDIHC